MSDHLVDTEPAVVTHDGAPEVAQPRETAPDSPAPLVASQHGHVLPRRPATGRAVRSNQGHSAMTQPLAKRVALAVPVSNHPGALLSWTFASVPPSDPDRLKLSFREADFRRGGSVKSHSQRNTATVYHHLLRPLAPLGFADSACLFFAGERLPSRNDLRYFNCCHSFNSGRHTRQIVSQTPRSSQSFNRRQHVCGEGDPSDKSCHRAPLRRIYTKFSSTLRSGAGDRPTRDRGSRLGSKGRIFSHWASVNNKPCRAVGISSGADPFFYPRPHANNYSKFNPLSRVLK